MTRYSVLIEIEVVRNYVINNFEYYDQLLNMHCFLTFASKVDQKTIFFCEMAEFFRLHSDSWSEILES